MAYLPPAEVTKPETTTLRDVADADFEEDVKKILEFMVENDIPVFVDKETENDGYVDISVGDILTIEAISIYHLKGWTRYSLHQVDTIIYGVNTGELDPNE